MTEILQGTPASKISLKCDLTPLLRFSFCPLPFFQCSRAEANLAPQIELAHHLVGQHSQRANLFVVKCVRLAVHDAQRADSKTLWRPQRHAGIETNKWFIDHERIIGKTFVEECVLDNKAIPVQDRMATERDVARRSTRLDSHPSFEP